MFAYLGGLEAIIGWVGRALAAGGSFAFTTEAHDGPGFTLRESRRYAHSEAYLRGLLQAAGFTARFSRAPLRMDRGAPIEGFVVIAQR